jgi:hypothetical protein
VDCGWDSLTSKCVVTSTPAPTPRAFGGLCNKSVVGMEDLRTVDWGQHDYNNTNLTEISAWHDNVMNKVGGLWYTTQREGWCDDASPGAPATGPCFWRYVRCLKIVTAPRSPFPPAPTPPFSLSP